MADTTALVPVFSGVISNITVQLCDARALHAFMGVGRDFTNWIKGRIAKFGFVAGEDFITVENLSSPDLASAKARQQKLIDYHLTLYMAKELAMVENNAQGRAARKYFIACERELMAARQPALPYSVQPGQTLSAQQAQALRELLTSSVKRLPPAKQAGAMVQGWSRLKSHFGTDYRHIPASEFHEAVSIIARHAAQWELVDETPAASDMARTRAAFDAAAQAAASVQTTVFNALLSGTDQWKHSRWLLAFIDDSAKGAPAYVHQLEEGAFVASWPTLVADIESGECLRSNAELLAMASACTRRVQQRTLRN